MSVPGPTECIVKNVHVVAQVSSYIGVHDKLDAYTQCRSETVNTKNIQTFLQLYKHFITLQKNCDVTNTHVL